MSPHKLSGDTSANRVSETQCFRHHVQQMCENVYPQQEERGALLKGTLLRNHCYSHHNKEAAELGAGNSIDEFMQIKAYTLIDLAKISHHLHISS